MRRIVTIITLLAAALALSATGFADDGGHGKGGKTKLANGKLGPYTMTRTDGSSCGVAQPWANDTFVRTYKVKRNKNGTYRIERRDRGTFVTLGTLSPGKCETTSKHGSTVRAGVKGNFHGYLVGVVSGGTFNPNATCSGNCGATPEWVAAFFGPSATFSCSASPTSSCRYSFEYSAPKQNLKYHHWQDRGVNDTEVFHGDIAEA